MRMSQLFSRTLREIPAEADTQGYQLLLRAGFIRQQAAGIFSELPLARRACQKIENIIRQEMNVIGGQEVKMPVVNPAGIWKESGRWYKIDAELARFKDRSDRDMVLAMTHEESVADLVRNEIQSYRQLPMLIYHIQTKWRDDPRPRAGLVRAREFTMKDSYSLDATWDGLDIQYAAHYQAYFKIFKRCGIEAIAVAADVGIMGGQLSHEYMFLTPTGEDSLLLCDHCGYAANRQVARFQKIAPASEPLLPVEKVATPGAKTIADLAAFLGIAEDRTAKAVFFMGTFLPDTHEAGENEERLIFAIVRGDMELNETKLANLLGARALRPATEAEIRAVGAVPGYASPVGLAVEVVVDDLIERSTNLVAGANEDGYHLRNVNLGRDFDARLVGDIAAAQEGSPCPDCGRALRLARGIEVGNIFKLGTHFSDALGCTFVDQTGQLHPVIMGSYGIGVGRLLACIAEAHHDETGLVWPVSVAPFDIHLVALAGKPRQQHDVASSNLGDQALSPTRELAERLYSAIKAAGLEVLYDDRDDSPGVKFNDADLIGLPIRLTVSERALNQGGVEFKRRDQKEKVILAISEDEGQPPFSSLISTLQQELSALAFEMANSS